MTAPESVELEVVAGNLGFTEGPVALPSGEVYVCSNSHAAVYRIEEDGHPNRIDTGGGANGLTADASGALYVAQNGGAWTGGDSDAGVQRIVGGDVTFVLTGMSAPNDICFGPDGRLYFTDPRREGKPYEPEAGIAGRVWSCERDGSDARLLHEGLRFPNGLAFAPDGRALYLAETATRLIHALAWADGEIGEPEPVATLPDGAPDGMAFDAAGNLYVAGGAADCLHVLSPEHDWVGVVPAPVGSLPTNCCFGGPDGRTLYVTGGRGGVLLRGSVDVPGHPLWG